MEFWDLNVLHPNNPETAQQLLQTAKDCKFVLFDCFVSFFLEISAFSFLLRSGLRRRRFLEAC
jgi:hypothetical protein